MEPRDDFHPDDFKAKNEYRLKILLYALRQLFIGLLGVGIGILIRQIW